MTQHSATGLRHVACRVIANRPIARDYYRLEFTWDPNLPLPQPGQFLTLRIGPGPSPLLRRPFAFAGPTEIIYQRRGTATTMLTALRPGDTLDALAPLGNHFVQSEPTRRPVLVAGGIGMGPLFFFAAELARHAVACTLVVGARTADLVPPRRLLAEILQSPTIEWIVATDDGSLGERGSAVDSLRRRFGSGAGTVSTGAAAGAAPAGTPSRPIELFACGPTAMMYAAADFATTIAAPAWLSMEQTMGCAVGACMGCVIPVVGDQPYRRVCVDGPVFAAESLRRPPATVPAASPAAGPPTAVGDACRCAEGESRTESLKERQ